MSDLPSPSPGALTYPEATPSLDPNEQPTWVRYRVLAFLAAMTFILYLDRSCINQAAPIIKRETGDQRNSEGHHFRMRSRLPTRSSRFRPDGGATGTARVAS